jgi:hypothetical protein
MGPTAHAPRGVGTIAARRRRGTVQQMTLASQLRTARFYVLCGAKSWQDRQQRWGREAMDDTADLLRLR